MHRLLARFKADDRGAIALMPGVSIIVLRMVVGGAIDFARYSSAKSQTAAALEAAVLAGARTLMLTGDPSKAEAAAATYYEENVAGRFTVEADSVQFSVTDENKTVTGSGNAYLPTTFLKVAGNDRLALVNDPTASFPKATISGGGGGNIEVSMTLDVTRSMRHDGFGPCTTGTKIDALKTAAKDPVNIVVLDDQSQFKSRVALVPFAQRIRVAQNGQGADLMRRMTDLDATWSGWRRNCTHWNITGSGSGESGTYTTGTCNAYESEWLDDWKIRPCVTERFYDSSWTMDFTDDKPGKNAWLNGETGRRFPDSMDSASPPLYIGAWPKRNRPCAPGILDLLLQWQLQ